MDDEFWARMHAVYSDDELTDLTICCGMFHGMGRAGFAQDDLRATGVFVGSTDDADEDTVTVTESGSALYQRLNAQVQGVAALMYAGLEVDDLAVAYRVLSTLTERANALLARAS
jgi:hypothetical protein